MASSFKVIVPQILVRPPKTFIDDLNNVYPDLISNKQSFQNAANATNLPISVLMTVAMVEQTGKHYNGKSVAVSGSERSVGIMQISPAGFYEALKSEIPKKRLSNYSVSEIKKRIPTFIFSLGYKIPNEASGDLLDNIFLAIKDYNFNILAAAICFRKLIEETADGNDIRLDRAIIKYNVGEYSKPTKTIAFKIGDTTNIVKNAGLNTVTKSYIVKAVGVDGGMDFFTKKGL